MNEGVEGIAYRIYAKMQRIMVGRAITYHPEIPPGVRRTVMDYLVRNNKDDSLSKVILGFNAYCYVNHKRLRDVRSKAARRNRYHYMQAYRFFKNRQELLGQYILQVDSFADEVYDSMQQNIYY